MKKMIRLSCLLFLCSTILVSVFAQTEVQVNNVRDLDRESTALGTLIAAQLKRNTGSIPAVLVDRFTYQNMMTNLGTVMNQNIINTISVNAEGRYQVIAGGMPGPQSASAPRADYRITGEIIDIGNIFRIYTRLIRTADNTISYSWQTDFQKTMYIMSLVNVNASGGTSFSMDIYEFDSFENPVPISLGQGNISRTIHSGDDKDWFIFTAEQDSILLFLADGSEGLDTYMKIYDSGRNQIASNDDYGDGLDAGILHSIRSGETIYINVYGYDSDETGPYTLNIEETRIEDQAMEPNDSMEQAYHLIEPGTYHGFFMSDEDADWYRIRVASQNMSLRIYTEGDQDTYIVLYDENGNEITRDDDSGSSYNARITYAAAPGTYYIEVTEIGGDFGSYDLCFALQDPPRPDSFEPDNSMNTAKEIFINAAQNHTFTDSDDEDWVFFNVTRSGNYTITARGEDTDFDTYIELYDEYGDLIDENDDGGDHYDSRLMVELSPGRYYILATALEDFDSPENYTLTVRY